MDRDDIIINIPRILPQVINELGNCYPIWAIYTAEYNVLCLNLINGMVSQIVQIMHQTQLIVSFRMAHG